jgi:MoaA/NifB/PqqE/SkfB family radical SAM enzyme
LSILLDAARLEIQQRSHRVHILPIIIIYLNNVCDSECITCSIWKNNSLLKIPAHRQMPQETLEELYGAVGRYRPQQILLSGGEPLLHPKFAEAVDRFRRVAPAVAVVSNGLTLGACEREAVEKVSDFFISFDAPDAEGYRQIRGVDGFDRLANSLTTVRRLHRRPGLTARCTLQRLNVRRIPPMIRAARDFGFDRISFLGVDVSSSAFSRDIHGPANASRILPTREDVDAMERDILGLDPSDGFIEGGGRKLKRILQFFRAATGDAPFPSVHCNAPWASMVVETTGQMRGCFFQPVIGDFRSVNGERAVRFRRELNVSTDPTCERCVCSKFLGPREFIAAANGANQNRF